MMFPGGRVRGWLRVGAAFLLVLVAFEAPAQTYSVEIRPELNGLDIAIEQIPQASMLILRLTNNTSTTTRNHFRCARSSLEIVWPGLIERVLRVNRWGEASKTSWQRTRVSVLFVSLRISIDACGICSIAMSRLFSSGRISTE
jgi:hypothetical protein